MTTYGLLESPGRPEKYHTHLFREGKCYCGETQFTEVTRAEKWWRENKDRFALHNQDGQHDGYNFPRALADYHEL